MKHEHADQIAHLLNTRNKLEIVYDAARVLQHADEYMLDLSDDGRVACCAQLKKVQWYQAEICHVTTHPGFARQKRGLRMLQRAEVEAKEQGARLLQCTIRVGNEESEGLFAKAKFKRGVAFLNPQSGNVVCVWAKALYLP